MLADDEVRWFWAACDSLGEPFGALYRLLLVTGARREEAAQITRSEVSEDGTTWQLPGERTKNHRAHEVPLSPLAREVLASVRSIAGRLGLVFTTTGTTPVSAHSYMKARLDERMLELARAEAEAARTRSGGSLVTAVAHPRPAPYRRDRHGARGRRHAHSGEGGEPCERELRRHRRRVPEVRVQRREKRAALEAWANLLTEITSVEPRGEQLVPITLRQA